MHRTDMQKGLVATWISVHAFPLPVAMSVLLWVVVIVCLPLLLDNMFPERKEAPLKSDRSHRGDGKDSYLKSQLSHLLAAGI